MRRAVYRISSALVALVCLAAPVDAAWSMKSHNAAQTAGPCTGGADISLTVDTSAANVVVAITVANDAQTAPGGTDSWSTGIQSDGNIVHSGLYYVATPTKSASYSVTLSNTNRCACLAVAAFDSTASGSVTLHNTSKAGSTCSGSTCQAAASVGASGELVVTGLTVDWLATATIDSSFTILEALQFNSGTAYGCAIAWKETAGTENPTWSYSSTMADTVLAAFTAGATASGGGGTTPHCGSGLLLRGVGCDHVDVAEENKIAL